MSTSLQKKKAEWCARLFALKDKETSALALDIFRYQSLYNPTYYRYLQALQCDPTSIDSLERIPCLPVSLYRLQHVRTGEWPVEACFQSSGTTDKQPSLHFVDDLLFYERVATCIFEQIYEPLQDTLILALLPDYLSRPNSSLIHMLKAFMKRSGRSDSGFFIDDWETLSTRICEAANDPLPKQLWGLPLALLDFSEAYPNLPLKDFVVVETGGAKQDDHRSRADLYQSLRSNLRPKALHSEYGMTELLSQAYSTTGLCFRSPPWMSVFARHLEDPLQLLPRGEVGPLNIIDLANMHSCAFLATDDLGRVYKDGSFELLGRATTTPRGCHLLYEK